jgi:hexosaminidase
MPERKCSAAFALIQKDIQPLMKKLLSAGFLMLVLPLAAQHSAIFPQPNAITQSGKSFRFHVLSYAPTPETDSVMAVVARQQFGRHYGISFMKVREESANLVFTKSDLKPEHYKLEMADQKIRITYGDKAGLLYALQSLDQLTRTDPGTETVMEASIVDGPAFSWRGVHLDCSRHFFTVAEIKQFLDQMLTLKLNTFHWHLTDDQGWRLEIKRYPKLTEVGAWRDSTVIGHFSRTPREYEHKRYGGFYTQEEAKEIVRYAAERGITVVPEIELPGHARAALAAYPELGCTGEQLPVPGLWGVFDDVFCSRPETIAFLENVLEEVIAVFPSQTIHIGGDECPKVRWDSCPNCQRVREENGLHDSHELQSYVIRRMEEFLRARGRKLMGWDEILEGGLAENAQVMSWRGIEGGIAAAKQQHPVVMTPTAFCYFDYYQSGHPDEPLAIGGYLPLEKVYAFDPVPDGLTEEEQAYILGAQANLWTEYLPEMEDVYYNAFPRLVAMAEVLWTKERPAYESFVQQLTEHYLPRLRTDGINHSTAFLDPKLSLNRTENGIVYTIDPAVEGIAADPPMIALPQTDSIFTIDAEVSASHNDTPLRTTNYRFVSHSLLGVPVKFATPPDAKFDHHGELGLTDGVTGKRPWKGDQWLGFWNDTVSFSIDLGEERVIRSVGLGTLHDPGSWICHPRQIVVESSADGKMYERWKPVAITSEKILVENETEARYLRITVVNDPIIPAGNPGAGNVPWTFLDELIIR